MNLLDTLDNISKTNNSIISLKYCLVTKDKLPFKIDGSLAKPNIVEDFVDLNIIINNLNNIKIDNYKGVGISIQASNISAIDVDHCFETPFDIKSGDNRAKELIEMFKDFAYIEFSFSGTGLRILFKTNIIEDYSTKYYIKNANNSIEYYQPTNSFRYVTVTGKYIYNNEIKESLELNKNIILFLDKYMKREEKKKIEIYTTKEETRTFEELLKLVKFHYFKDGIFQNLWFDKAPGSGSNESERDFHLVAYLYQHITQDKDLIKQLFESSPFFKSKDWKHKNKWNYQNFRYYNYLYDNIRR